MSSLMGLVDWLNKHDKHRYLALCVIILVLMAGIYAILTGGIGLVIKVLSILAL